MSSIFKSITSQKPYFYGLSYLCLVPLYAVAFSFLPDASLKLNGHESGFISGLYFSVITITTLGYGDITPVGPVSQLLTASESLLGISLIGLFLNALSHQHGIEVQEAEKQKQVENERKLAKNRFLAFNQLVELNIGRYNKYTMPVTTPINDRKTEAVNESFVFSDMQDLFKTTLRVKDHAFTPAIDYYFRSQKELILSLEDLLKHGYAQHWQELQDLCLQFIFTLKELDFSEYILNQPNINLKDEKGSDFDVKMIKMHEGKVKFLPGSNSLNGYVALYFQIHAGFEFVKEYRRLASEIKNG